MPSFIPIVQTTDRLINQLQQGISQALRPLFQNPLLFGNSISVDLIIGTNIIPHGLQRPQQGWIITDSVYPGISTIYRTQPFNATNLTLSSSAKVSVVIYCF